MPQTAAKRNRLNCVDVGHVPDVFDRAQPLLFEAGSFDEMVGMEADQQLTGLRQAVPVDQVCQYFHIREIGMEGLEAARICEKFPVRLEPVPAEIVFPRDKPFPAEIAVIGGNPADKYSLR